jgi:hypothetical protein
MLLLDHVKLSSHVQEAEWMANKRDWGPPCLCV